MTSTTLLAAAGIDVLTAALYLHVASLTLRALPRGRDGSAEAFALFWLGIGAANALAALLEGVAAFRDPGLALTFAISSTRFALGLASFAGLMYYLAYVYTGRRAARVPVLALFALAFVLIQVWLFQSAPVGAAVGDWRVDLAFANAAVTPLYAVLVLVFFGPPLVCAAAYLLLLRRVESPSQVRRARLLAASLVVYFAGLTLGYLLTNVPSWALVEAALSIGAAMGAIAAFRPPIVRPLVVAARADSALAQRVRDLV